MKQEDLKIGDIVAIYSEPYIKMTVSGVSNIGAQCIWFNHNLELMREYIPLQALTMYTKANAAPF